MTTAFPAAHVRLSAPLRLSQRVMANMSLILNFAPSAALVQMFALPELHRQIIKIIKSRHLKGCLLFYV
jgi:hypothetical protein